MNSHNSLPIFNNKYIWFIVDRFEVGPRREITLFMKLDRSDTSNPHEHNWEDTREPATIVPVRFGGVKDLKEVQAFFERLLTETTKRCGIQLIYKFDYDWKQESKPNEI